MVTGARVWRDVCDDDAAVVVQRRFCMRYVSGAGADWRSNNSVPTWSCLLPSDHSTMRALEDLVGAEGLEEGGL